MKNNALDYLEGQSKLISETELLQKIDSAISKIDPLQNDFNRLLGFGEIVVVCDTIIDIVDFLFGGGKALQAVIDYVNTQLNHLVQLLNKVMQILFELQVFIQEQFRLQAVYQVRSQILIILDSFEQWNENPEKYKEDITYTYLQLRATTTTAMSYGYAHHDSIALAMTQHYLLSVLKGDSNSTVSNYLTRYITYFQEASNYAVNGSVAYRQLQIAQLIKNYENEWIPKDVYCGINEIRQGRCDVQYEVYLKVSGDLYNGFQYSIWSKPNGKKKCDPSEHEPTGPRPFTNADTGSVQQLWEQKRHEYIDLLANYKILTDSLSNCSQYISSAQKLMGLAK